jgi:hypothetical protein
MDLNVNEFTQMQYLYFKINYCIIYYLEFNFLRSLAKLERI